MREWRNIGSTERERLRALKAPLIERYQKGDNAAGDALVRMDEGLIVEYTLTVMRRWKKLPPADKDALQAGRLGYLEAVKRYDFRDNATLATYAWHWVRAYVGDHFKEELRQVCVPRHTEASDSAAQIEGRAKYARPVSIDTTYTDRQPLMMRIRDRRPMADTVIDNEALLRALDKAVASLPGKLRIVIEQHFFEGATLAEIGKGLGYISRERPRQIQVQALQHIKRSLAEQGVGEAEVARLMVGGEV